MSTVYGDESHDIPSGSRAIRESAKVDGEFGTCYYCLACVDRQLDIEAGYRAGFCDDEIRACLDEGA